MRTARLIIYSVLAALLSGTASARAEWSLGAGVLLSRADRGLRLDTYRLEARRETPADGQWVALDLYEYSLDESLAGLLPFSGSEPSTALGSHLLLGLWWLSAEVGLQGSIDRDSVMGKLVVARAIPTDSDTFTPRIELAREPLALSPLPLSLALSKYRFDALLAWRGSGWLGEGGARLELWQSRAAPSRTQNEAEDVIDANRITILHAYALSDGSSFLDFGGAAKAAWAEHGTMLLTGLNPAPTYTWYPASAPPFAWETAFVLRAQSRSTEPLQLMAQLQLPLLSQEVREWEGVRRSYWGSAPFQAKLQARWAIFSSTTLQLEGAIFAKPWEHWDVLGAGAYHEGSLTFSIEQRL
jgi:hypothetical protein